MRSVLVAMAAAFVLLDAASASAENASTLQAAKLDTDFTLCPEGAEKCSLERWRIAVNAKGWTMQARTRVDLQVENWTESCTDGRYVSDAAGYAWTGTCSLSGEPDALCFDVAMESEAAATTATSQQCFQLLAPHICTMRFESSGGPAGSAPDSPERVAITLGTVNSCVVSEAQ
jgi:hypothetical protein